MQLKEEIAELSRVNDEAGAFLQDKEVQILEMEAAYARSLAKANTEAEMCKLKHAKAKEATRIQMNGMKAAHA